MRVVLKLTLSKIEIGRTETMNDKEIEEILQSCLREEIYEYPTNVEWIRLEECLDCKFCNEFKIFINMNADIRSGM